METSCQTIWHGKRIKKTALLIGENMTKIFNGRYTAKTDQPFVVFLIGMRINKWWRFDKWFPVASAMGPMLQTLFTHPEKGFLHAEFYWNSQGPILIQYWRSFEDLERFARQPSDPHVAAWKKFNQAIGADGSVGIWHETYTVNPDQFESVYGNMPRFGLAAAIEHVEAVGRRQTARKRLDANKPHELIMEAK
jgi:fumigallin biosynthesis monooxygenase-like protein